ncbi:MAG TPA: J domain-containing protein [Bacteroidales bacterium]|nr:J domain-containing protein [Bacteroidales bacterium]
MNLWEYYKILGIRQGASDAEIRKAYRVKAMEFHPDRNHSPGAQDMFVKITEAYQYLIAHPHNNGVTEEDYSRYYQAWVDYRQAEARKKAEEYASSTFKVFSGSPLYKSTTVIDGSMVFLGLALAVAVICIALFGYTDKMNKAVTPEEEPSFTLMILTLIIGIIYFIISLLYLSAWVAQKKRQSSGKESQN